MSQQGKDLSGVTVVAKAPPVIQKGDTSQFSASQYKVNPDATTEDLIKKMPGITVDKDGTVTAQGEQVKKVTIDGKDFFGDDASAALKNLPSEVVDKIQVFDKLSDQAQLTGYDDGNSVKAINIVTKSGIKNGQFGRAYVGYGTNDRYNAGGNVSFFKGERRLSFVGNFNNINQQNFGSQDLLGLTSSGNSNKGGGSRPSSRQASALVNARIQDETISSVSAMWRTRLTFVAKRGSAATLTRGVKGMPIAPGGPSAGSPFNSRKKIFERFSRISDLPPSGWARIQPMIPSIVACPGPSAARSRSSLPMPVYSRPF